MYAALFILWIIFNGRFTPEVAVIGLAVSAAIFLFICRFMDYSIRKEKMFYILLPWMLKYFLILLCEIVKANIKTASIILNPKMVPEPKLVTFKPDIRYGFLKAVLANSITLTPGTITINIEDGEYMVHCLDMELATDIGESVFVKEIKKAQERLDKVK
ncbi:MAG: Na+/H+ antiporter subunit E [Lachnospiraceae bacterium]|nr:Na+/H+ antiporter subunit E [Lachnospiraceae bacterium]